MALILDSGVEPIAGYKLVRLLGRGGFGEVWEARAPGGVRVALKFIRLDTRAAGAEQRALAVIRNIRHPHLLDVQFATRVDDCLVIAMPLCDQNLMQRLRACQSEGFVGLPRDELLGYMEELARAVDYLNGSNHQLEDVGLVGVQHRDIKPHNIFLVGDSVRLADFGLAKILAAGIASHTGSMSPSYVAPEVLEGQVSKWSDQYSLAATYTHLRAGRPLFVGESVHEVLYAHVHNAPDLSNLPEEERPILARALAKRPERRWPHCRAFAFGLIEAARTLDARLAADRGPVPQAPPSGHPTEPTTVGVTKLPDPSELWPSMPLTLREGTASLVPRPARPRAPGSGGPRAIVDPPGISLAPIPAGEFTMGSPEDDPHAHVREGPQRRVRITRPFYLGVYPVTQEEYEAVMGCNPSWFSPTGKGKGQVSGRDTRRHPVERVSWNDAIAFCNALSEREGLKPFYPFGEEGPLCGEGYRLPTEAEWEHACRSGSTTAYHFGNDAASLAESAWFRGNSGSRTHPVGQNRPNAFGLHDLHGNVWEWCWDGYSEPYDTAGPTDDPTGPASSAERVIRGGSWGREALAARSASRYGHAPDDRYFDIGFRVARAPLPL